MQQRSTIESIELEVRDVVQETPQDRTFVLPVPPEHANAFQYLPGQFVVVTDPAAAKPLRRAYSISCAPSDPPALHLTVRDMGFFGRTFYRFPIGKRLLVRPPQGRFVLEVAPGEHLIFAAGGSGVTPFRAFVQHLCAHDHADEVWLFQSARHAEELLFRDTFEEVAAARPWFHYQPTLTRAAADTAWSGDRGRLDAARMRPAMHRGVITRFYACGPGAFVRAMFSAADDLGIPARRRRREQWG